MWIRNEECSRYNMLKDMIKGVLRDPNYMEVCHEDINQYEDEVQ